MDAKFVLFSINFSLLRTGTDEDFF